MAMDAAAAAANGTTTVDHIEPDTLSENICLNDIVSLSSNGARMQEPGNAGELLTRVELDVAYCSEKLLNLDVLLMRVSARENECGSFPFENITEESVEKGLEFDLLSGILDSELRELNAFMDSLQREIAYVHQKNSYREHFKEAFIEIEDKLQDSEETLNQSQNQLGKMKLQFAKFQRVLSIFNGQENCDNKDLEPLENGQLENIDTNLMAQTAQQQKHILRMLEKSLARELVMERNLCDSRNNEEEIRMKLQSAEQELFWMEEETEVVFERLFEAENAAELLMGISKGLMGRLQLLQFNLNGSVQREGDMRSKLENSIEQFKIKESSLDKLQTSNSGLDDLLHTQTKSLKDAVKEAEDKYNLADSESSSLRKKIHSLEEQLKESEAKLLSGKVSAEESKEQQNIASSKLSELESVVDELKGNIAKEESRANSLAANCSVLTEINVKLSEELDSLRSKNLENVNSLEKKLRESNTLLQHEKASAEATQEQQSMLYSAIDDMETLIDDLKSKVSKAESRAEKAEAKCALLSETNLEINEELAFLRSRMESLETSLHQADDEKLATAKDINTKTKAISDLVLRLVTERERLQKQISSLVNENKVLAAKSIKASSVTTKAPGVTMKASSVTMNHISEDEPSTCAETSDIVALESSAASIQTDKLSKDATIFEQDEYTGLTKEGVVTRVSTTQTVRSIDVCQVNSKYYLVPIVVLLFSILGIYLYQLEKCPF